MALWSSTWLSCVFGLRNCRRSHARGLAPPFRWRRVWEKIARHLELELGEPIPFALADHMPALKSVWQELSAGLVQPDLSKAVGWSFGDFVFGTEADVVSDMTKNRLAGFHEDLDPVLALIHAIERQVRGGVIPGIGERSYLAL